MRYFVKWEYIETGTALPAKQVSDLLRKAVIPSLKMCAELEEAGTFMAGGVFAGSRASAVIVEAGSHEELSRLLQSLPFWSLMKMNITPIQSFADRAEQESKAADIFDQLREAGELPW